MKFFTRNKQAIPITPQVVREDVDDDNPITFATPFEDNDADGKEMEAFGDQIKENFNIKDDAIDDAILEESPDTDEFWNDVTKEIDGIEDDDSLVLFDKMNLLLDIYDNYRDGMPRELSQRIIADLLALEKKYDQERREDGLRQKDEQLLQKVRRIKSEDLEIEELPESRRISARSVSNLTPREKRVANTKSRNGADEWEHELSLLILEAERQ